MASSNIHTILVKLSSRQVFFLCALGLSIILASIEVFNTYVLFSNYDNPPPLIPYPAYIRSISFSLAVWLIYAVNHKTISFRPAKAVIAHLLVGVLFCAVHIYVSNLSDWYFFDRDWTIAGSFQFVFTTHFLFELLIYMGVVGMIFALNTIKEKYTEQESSEFPPQIEIKQSGKIKFIPVEHIIWIEADDNYINLHTGEKSYLLRKRLKEVLHELDPSLFQQIHRSYIVNVTHIKEIELHSDGGAIVYLNNEHTLKASKTYRKALQRTLATQP